MKLNLPFAPWVCLLGVLWGAPLNDPWMASYRESFIKDRLPPVTQAVPVFDTGDFGNYFGTFSVVDVTGQKFSKAMRFEVRTRPKHAYDLQAQSIYNTAPIKAGDVIFFAVPMRCLQTLNESGEAEVPLWFVPKGKWDFSIQLMAGREWTTTYGFFVAKQDYPTNALRLHFMLSKYQQTLEIGGLLVLNVGGEIDPSKLPKNIFSYAGRETDAAWRRLAEERIEQIRKGDLEVSVKTAQGKTVANAEIRIAMTRHAYRFGAYVEKPVLESTENGDAYRSSFSALFNAATVPMFWGPGLVTNDKPDGGWGWSHPKVRQDYLAMAAWAQKQGLKTAAHTLMYEAPIYNPTSVIRLTNDSAALRKAVDDHILDIVSKTRPFEFFEWQVINEHLQSSFLSDFLGGEAETGRWFNLVRTTDPKPRLAVNEGIPWTHLDTVERFEHQISGLKKNGFPVESIGIQSHDSGRTGIEHILSVLDRLAKLGLPISATEFDAAGYDEDLQADFTRDFYTAFFSHPATEGITTWSFWEGVGYDPKKALFRKDWTLKPNGGAYTNLVLGKWWTRRSGKTDTEGRYSLRGFLGEYEITVKGNGLEKKVSVILPKGGLRITVILD